MFRFFFMYRAKIMIYVKVVLKIRYDPRVKRLSKSQKKGLNSLLSSVWKKCRKKQSMQKNMDKKNKNKSKLRVFYLVNEKI